MMTQGDTGGFWKIIESKQGTSASPSITMLSEKDISSLFDIQKYMLGPGYDKERAERHMVAQGILKGLYNIGTQLINSGMALPY